MTTPATPNPMSIKKFLGLRPQIATVDERVSDSTRKAEETDLDKLVRNVEQKIEDAHAPKTSQERKRFENRKRAQSLKKTGLSNTEIAELMHLPESTIRILLKPYEPKPHLTQRIEGLDALKKELHDTLKKQLDDSRSSHPSGRSYKGKRSGGK